MNYMELRRRQENEIYATIPRHDSARITMGKTDRRKRRRISTLRTVDTTVESEHPNAITIIKAPVH